MLPRYKYLDHTADVAFKAYGTTVEEVFEHAAEALVETMTDLNEIQPMAQYTLTVAAEDLEMLMVRWLNELLYRFETEELLLGRFHVNRLKDFRLTASCRGERLDPDRHAIKTGIKGVTYHGLYVKQQRNTWESRVVLDI